MIDYAVYDEGNIKGFFNEYRWLSNFHRSPVIYNNITYPSVEHAYQIAKIRPCDLYSYNIPELNKLTCAEIKKYGQLVPIRKDWNRVKIFIMTECIHNKFKDPILKEKLLNTGDKHLEEKNCWGDRFWGTDTDGVGQNNLGKILMAERNNIKQIKIFL